MSKTRADQLLLELNLEESREKARRLIMAGQVYMVRENGQEELVDKPGRMLPEGVRLRVRNPRPFVGRGGEKLATALEFFELDVRGAVALDIGASTGGFVDCLLKAGAARVYAVDVGRGLLDYGLRQDARVTVLEGVNFRYAQPDLLAGALVDLVVVDVSFISLTLILPACRQFLKPEAEVICLVKPQFELGPGQTDKGVVRDQALRDLAVRKIQDFAVGELGWRIVGVTPSRVKGSKGNQEYLLFMRAQPGA